MGEKQGLRVYIISKHRASCGLSLPTRAYLSGLDEEHELGDDGITSQVFLEDFNHPPQREQQIHDTKQKRLSKDRITHTTKVCGEGARI